MFKYIFFSVLFLSTILRGQVIATFAGTGSSAYTGDGIPALTAGILNPGGGAFDRDGNYYFADGQNSHRIRKIDNSGTITTVAGNGIPGFTGDGGTATSAQLNTPQAVCFDTSGNLYICDLQNNRIRRVDAITKIITTVAGDGMCGFSGDNSSATLASLCAPQDICIDRNGNLFIADIMNYRIRRVDKSGIITTIAGNGIMGFSGDGGQATSAQLALPVGITVNNIGNLFIADWSSFSNRIRKIDNYGIITTIAGNGFSDFTIDKIPATTAALVPLKISFSLEGNLFIADRYNNRVYMIDDVGILHLLAGDGFASDVGDGNYATASSLNIPTGVSVDRCGNIYIPTVGNVSIPGSGRRIRKVTYNPPPCTYLGTQPMVSAAQLTLTPNPTTSTLTITSPTTIAYIALHNAVGQVVLWQRAATREAVLDVAALPAGVYVVRVTDANGAVAVRRVVKE